jgi:hypothetical protein
MFPLFAVVLSLLYSRVSQGTFQPIIPNLTLNTLIQAGTIVGTSLALGRQPAWTDSGVLFTIFILFTVLLFQIYIFQSLRDKTTKHLKLLLSRNDLKVKENCLSKDTLQEIAIKLIEVDIIPNFFFSEHKKEQRELFYRLLVETTSCQPPGLEPNSFLLPEEERNRWARYYRLVGGLSWIIFIVTLVVYLRSI